MIRRTQDRLGYALYFESAWKEYIKKIVIDNIKYRNYGYYIKEGIQEVVEDVKIILNYLGNEFISNEKKEEIITNLEKLSLSYRGVVVNDPSSLMKKIWKVLKPLVKAGKKDFVLYEKRLTQASCEIEGFISLNRILSYHIEADRLYIHLSSAVTLETMERKRLILEGQKLLGDFLSEDNVSTKINFVVAESELVGSYDKLLKRYGFVVNGNRAIVPKENLLNRLKNKHYGDMKKSKGNGS